MRTITVTVQYIYIQRAIEELRETRESGINIQGHKIDMLRFADDMALLAESEEQLEQSLQELERIMKNEYNMKLNKKKTKVMICTKQDNRNYRDIMVDGEAIQQVEQFPYLGSIITKDGRSKKEIIKRIQQAKRAFINKKNLLTSGKLSNETKIKFIQTYIWSVATYGSETWTIGTQEKRRLESLEMWCYRKMMKISWVERVTNQEVLRRAGTERKLWKHIQKRRDQLIGHILRREGLLKIIMEGKIPLRNARGRPRLQYINQIMADVGSNNYTEMKRKAQDRKKWKAASNQSED